MPIEHQKISNRILKSKIKISNDFINTGAQIKQCSTKVQFLNTLSADRDLAYQYDFIELYDPNPDLKSGKIQQVF
jgi:hypothetical protein